MAIVRQMAGIRQRRNVAYTNATCRDVAQGRQNKGEMIYENLRN